MNRDLYLGHLMAACGRLDMLHQTLQDSDLITPRERVRRTTDDYHVFAAAGRVMEAGRTWMTARAHGTPEQLADANRALQRALEDFGIVAETEVAP